MLQNDIKTRLDNVFTLPECEIRTEVLIVPVLPLSYYRKKLHNLSNLSCVLHFSKSTDLNPVDNSM